MTHGRLTPEEYLRIERAAEWKSEYIDGEMFAMSGSVTASRPDHVKPHR
jgi:Uma2 family endonuclease